MKQGVIYVSVIFNFWFVVLLNQKINYYGKLFQKNKPSESEGKPKEP